MGVLDAAALDLQGALAARPAASLRGRYYWATDSQQLFRDDGAAWTLLWPAAIPDGHSWTMDDQTGQNPTASSLGSWFVPPQLVAETWTLYGVIAHCTAQGGTPSTFAVKSDHGAHGTLSPVSGLASITPSTTQAFTPVSGGAMALSALDRITVIANNAGSGTSTGITVEAIVICTP